MNDLDTQAIILAAPPTIIPELEVSETSAIEIVAPSTGPTRVVSVPVSAHYPRAGRRRESPPVPASLHVATLALPVEGEGLEPGPDRFWLWVTLGAAAGGLAGSVVLGSAILVLT